MKKYILIIGILVFLLNQLGMNSALAANQTNERKKILSDVGKQIIFDAGSFGENSASYKEFHWDFGDGGSAEGEGVLHAYLNPGYYKASLTMVDSNSKEQKIEIDSYVYSNLMVAIIDGTADRNKLKLTEQKFFNQGMLLWVIEGNKPVSNIDEQVDVILDNKDIVQKASGILVWGGGNFDVDVLVKLSQRSDLKFSNFDVVAATGQGVGNMVKTASSAFNILNPKSLILVNDKAVDYLDSFSNLDNFIAKLKDEGLSYELIGVKDKYRLQPVPWWMLMSRLTNYALFNGVPLSTIALILTMPIIALLIAFSRQVVGIKAFGIYVPSLITLAFLESGFRYGTVVFLVVLAVGTMARMILKKIQITYLPRMGLVLTMVALGMLLMMALAAYLNLNVLKGLSIVPLLTMVILTEKFVSAQIRYGFSEATKLTLETYVLSAVCYYLVAWQTLKTLILAYPEAVLLVIPLLIILGKWSGLRLTEYWRFRRLLKS